MVTTCMKSRVWFSLAFMAAFCIAPSVSTADVYWNGTGADFNDSANWWTTAAGSTTASPAGDNCYFYTGSPSHLTDISLSADVSVKNIYMTASATSPVTISGHSLTLASGYVTATSTSGLLTIDSDVVLGTKSFWTTSNTTTGAGIVVNGVISGAYDVVSYGTTGTLTLNGANTFGKASGTGASGLILRYGGQVNFGNAAAPGVGEISFNNGSTFDNTSGESMTLSNNNKLLFFRAGTGTFVGSNDLNFGTGAVNLYQSYALDVKAGNLTIGGIITGTTDNEFGKDGSGTLTLSGANTYWGKTIVYAGVLAINNAKSLGAAAGSTTIRTNGALHIYGNITTLAETLELNGIGISGSGSLRNISGDNTYAGKIVLNRDSRINSDSGTLTISSADGITGDNSLYVGGSGSVTISGPIATGAHYLFKDGTGLLTLSGANTYTNTTCVYNGTLALAATGSLASTTVVLGDGTNAGVFNVSAKGADYDLAKLSGIGTVSLADSTKLNLSGAINHTGADSLNVIGGSLTLASGVSNTFEIDLATDLHDYASVGQTLNYNGTTLEIAFSGAKTGIGSYEYDILDFANETGAVLVSFSGLTSNETAAFDATTGIVTLTSVPEPSTIIMVVIGLAGIACRAARKRNRE